jgi:hypothetical protein
VHDSLTALSAGLISGLAVCFLQLPQPAQFTRPEVGILLLPRAKCLFSNAQLPTDIPDRGIALGLAEGIDDLFLRKP